MEEVEYIVATAKTAIKVDGQAIDTTIDASLIEWIIDNDLRLPDMISLRFDADDLTMVDDDTFKIGKSLEVTLNSNNTDKTLFKGEITAIEPVFGDGHVELVVRGYDKSHRLYRGKKTRVFANMTDSDVVTKIAQEAGLSADVDSTSATHEHVWQNNQTDMEFLRTLARRLGFHLYVEDQTLYCKETPAASTTTVTLAWGENLISFRPRISAAHQTDEVNVRSWDTAKKEAVVGTKTAATNTSHQGGTSSSGGDIAKTAFTAAATTLIRPSGLTQTEAEAMAQALLNRINSSFVQAEGLCIGNPDIKPGIVVELSALGERFSGAYLVTTTTHRFVAGAYETVFTVRGAQNDVWTHILEGDIHTSGAFDPRGLILGVVPGIVTDNSDTDDLGRVKVKYPWLTDELAGHWARLSALGGGAERGIYFIPEIDDEVLIAFEQGDFNRPIVLGGLWNGKDAAPKKSSEIVVDGKVNERIIRSRTGHVIILGDKENEEQIIIRDNTEKNEIIINSTDNTITINVEADYTLAAKGAVSSSSDKTTDIVSAGNMTLKADKGANITIQGNKIEIKGQGNIAVQATGNLDLKANGQLNIQGAKVSIQGQGMTEVKSSGILQIQGSLVKIN
ncbi:MAG: VgrG-related protein [Anaerolineae bacterium]|nr:VgrG-related protein [Anaerolineae bacterium]